MYEKFIIAFLIYSYSFCNLGNTCLRIDSTGEKVFNIIPLFTEGIYGPIRSIYLLLVHNGLIASLYYIADCLVNLHNIFGALLFVFYISHLFKRNYI
jgi:pilus assembly protein TadC